MVKIMSLPLKRFLPNPYPAIDDTMTFSEHAPTTQITLLRK